MVHKKSLKKLFLSRSSICEKNEKILSRPASNLETFFIYMNEHKLYSNFAIIGTYSTDLLQNKSILFATLRSLILNNTAFSLNYFQPDPKKEKWFLEPLDEIKFDDVVEYMSVPDVINDEFAAKLSEEYWFNHNVQEPLWKVIVINDSSIVFIGNHSLFDGESGVQFHFEFLKELNKVLRDQASIDDDTVSADQMFFPPKQFIEQHSLGSYETTVSDTECQDTKQSTNVTEAISSASTNYSTNYSIKENQTILFSNLKDHSQMDSINPPGEEIIDHRPSFKHMISTIIDEKLIPKFPKLGKFKAWLRNYKLLTNDRKPTIPPKSVFKFFNIPSSQANLIAAKCHELKISLTVWITLCLQYAFNEIVFPEGKTLPSMIAMNTRKFLKDKYRDKHSDLKFGLYVSGYSFNLKPLSELEHLVPFAQKESILLKKETKKRKGLQTIGTMNYIPSIKSHIADHSKTCKKLAIAVSNLGFRKTGPKSVSGLNTDILGNSIPEVYIENLIFTQGCAANDELLAVSTISTPDGGLNLLFGMEPDYSDDIGMLWDKYLEAFMSIV